ncbi:MAG TPA: hypothetical protein PLW31_01820 [Bacteroidales bacterium]|nr:hypothetical protein [Bacteroidales bacterium]
MLNSVLLFSQVAINTDGSTSDSSAMLDVKSSNRGLLTPRMTHAELNAISDPAEGLMVYCTDCGSNGLGSLSLFIAGVWYTLNTNCLNPSLPLAGSHVPSPDQIIWNWNTVAFATGYKWNTSPDYGTAQDLFTNTTKTEEGLTCGNSYSRYAWAYNDCGYSTPVTLIASTLGYTLACGDPFTINHVAGNVAPVNKTVTYTTVTNILGEPTKCWITSNLGSDRQATAVNDATEESAGWYWQFNRMQGYKHDGTTRIPNITWINSIDENSDWLAANDPCALLLGSGWRLPTSTEWINVDASGNWTNWNGPWNSALKMHAAGGLLSSGGSLFDRGSKGYYWSSSKYSNAYGWELFFYSSNSTMNSHHKVYGFSSRCLRD